MQFHLVQHRRHAGLADDPLDMFGAEIGNADRPRPALVLELHQCLPAVDIAVAARRWPVDEVEVDIVGAEPFEALVEGFQRGIVALRVVPELGGEENVLTVDAGGAHALADAVLVAVDRGRIDMAVAGFERDADRRRGDIVGCLPDAEPDLGDGIVIMEADVGLIGHVNSPMIAASAMMRERAGTRKSQAACASVVFTSMVHIGRAFRLFTATLKISATCAWIYLDRRQIETAQTPHPLPPREIGLAGGRRRS
jgi:hypothetical protein